MRHSAAIAVLAAGMFGTLAQSLAAQGTPTAVTTIQGLSFGNLTAGVAEPVKLTDAWRRAEVRLEGSTLLWVRMVLPTALVSSSGKTIPLQFTNGDASVTFVGSNRTTVYDPNVPHFMFFRGTTTAATMYLGGTARPAANQSAGKYTATVVVVLTLPGQ